MCAMKKVYYNRSFIGEVEATGDLDKDADVARNLLKERGIWRPHTEVEKMFGQAASFCNTAALLYEGGLKSVPRDGRALAPFVVNSAFGVEIFLKTLHLFHGTSARGHKLRALFDALPKETAHLANSKFAESIATRSSAHRGELTDALGKLNNAFVEWRYLHEHEKLHVEVQPLISVQEALFYTCKSLIFPSHKIGPEAPGQTKR